MSEACELSAVEARQLIGEKRLSPVELVESCIRRIEAVNPTVNAVVATCYERARTEAKAAEDAIMRGDPVGPLHGLPLGVKDLVDTAELRTTYGSLLYKDHVPQQDERLVEVLRRAGAIVLGKTNTPEFGAGANTTNKVYGPTRNPFDTARTCGGSSGGSAVALATDMVPICTGSDTGGSLRTPAAFCGVVSIRPTPGLVPSERRPIGLSTYGVLGPMARSVADSALMLSTIAGFDGRDPLAAPLDASALRQADNVDLSRLRVAVSEDLGFAPMDNGMRATFRERVKLFGWAFKECSERAPELDNANRVFWIIRGVHFLAAHSERYARHRELLGDNVKNNVAAALEMKAEDIAWAYAENTRLYRRFQSFFDEVDVLICPTVSVPPFPVEQLYCTHINGKELDNYIHWVDITAGITLTGHPVVALPCGRDPTGTPFSIQVIGPQRHSERFVIAVAAALERLFSTEPALARPRPDIGSLAQ